MSAKSMLDIAAGAAGVAATFLPAKYRTAAKAAAEALRTVGTLVEVGARPEDFKITRIRDIGPLLEEAERLRHEREEEKKRNAGI